MQNKDTKIQSENNSPISLESFSEVYSGYSPELLRYLLSSGLNTESAHDIVHDSFITLWELREKIADTDSLKPLWFTIARHKMIDFFRRKRFSGELPDTVVNRIPDSKPEQLCKSDILYLRQRITAALNELPPEMAECYKLTKISGLSIRDTSRILDITETSVKSKVFRAKQKLMVLLADLEDLH